MEQWKEIPGHIQYEASLDGRIRNKITGTIRKAATGTWGYHRISFRKSGKVKGYQWHRLVAITFIPNPENKLFVNHINGIKTDNRVSNLEWVTHQENMDHASATGLLKSPKYWQGKKGKYCPNSKPVVLTNVKTGQVFRFDSLGLAAKFIGGIRQDIHKSIKRNGQTKNYKARYE